MIRVAAVELQTDRSHASTPPKGGTRETHRSSIVTLDRELGYVSTRCKVAVGTTNHDAAQARALCRQHGESLLELSPHVCAKGVELARVLQSDCCYLLLGGRCCGACARGCCLSACQQCVMRMGRARDVELVVNMHTNLNDMLPVTKAAHRVIA
jgi:hypothetical protein